MKTTISNTVMCAHLRLLVVKSAKGKMWRCISILGRVVVDVLTEEELLNIFFIHLSYLIAIIYILL